MKSGKLPPEVRVFESSEALFSAAAEEFIKLAHEAMQAHGRFTVALSGGSTPKRLYGLLADRPSGEIPWDRICVFFVDERHVPPSHSDNNYHLADEFLLSRVPVSRKNIYRVQSEEPDATAVAQAYEETLKTFFRLMPGELPRFDLVLLGMGPDGHTASLFPHTASLKERSRLVVANWVEQLQTFRITVTYPVLNSAECVMFLVSGAEKQNALYQVLRGSASTEECPAQGVQPTEGRLLWMVDRAAAQIWCSVHGSMVG